MKATVEFKEGVFLELEALRPEMMHGLYVAALTCPDYGVLTVTSQADGEHQDNSLHFRGRAWDIRTRHMTTQDTKDWSLDLRMALGEDWDVVLEVDPPHLHIEYDPKST